MKKILLGTTALIGAATLYAGAASAEDPKVTVGGFNTFEAGWAKSDEGAFVRNGAFRNDTEIHFNIAGKSDMGLGYGAEIDLQADINGSNVGAGSTNQGLVAHRVYGWLQGDQWGHVEFGSNDGPAATLKVDASNIARATGGINGDWVNFAQPNQPANVANGNTLAVGNGFAGGRQFITSPRLPVENGPSAFLANDSWANDDKVTYYTPRFMGFQGGVSYAPSLANRGQATTMLNSSGTVTDASSVWEGGLNYENQFDQIGFAAALTGETSLAMQNVGAADTQNLGAWNIGAKATWMGWSLAGSYGDWRDSYAANGVKADYWTAGLAYEMGPWGTSVTYLGSESKPTGQDNKFTNVSFGLDYKLAPGLTPFVEYTWYDIDAGGGTALSGNVENRGNIIIVGSQLSF